MSWESAERSASPLLARASELVLRRFLVNPFHFDEVLIAVPLNLEIGAFLERIFVNPFDVETIPLREPPYKSLFVTLVNHLSNVLHRSYGRQRRRGFILPLYEERHSVDARWLQCG